MMKDGRPYSTENGYIDAALITDHPQQEIDAVFNWIAENICPRKTPLLSHTSYGLKHTLESDTGIYLTNNEFKDAMLSCGYTPVNPNALNWSYCISKRSLAFDAKARKK
ncbi:MULTISPECIES: hypothetical protein [unclassified Clostridium]|uniref:hypothetical protein n=1 Tax=unclassified Clostridium TaxID=2614128 RepID=UPI00321666D1